MDLKTIKLFKKLTNYLDNNKPFFVDLDISNYNYNKILKNHCEKLNIPVITLHGLRHTHSSLLILSGVSIGSISKRLGHSSIVTTQKTYLHIIKELEDLDNSKVMKHLSEL